MLDRQLFSKIPSYSSVSGSLEKLLGILQFVAPSLLVYHCRGSKTLSARLKPVDEGHPGIDRALVEGNFIKPDFPCPDPGIDSQLLLAFTKLSILE